MYRGQVTAVDSAGVYVLVPSLHPTAAFGPLDHVGARPAVGARVLVADCGDESAPDLVVMTGSGPATSTDNAVARFDGTGGALQNSGVTIDDSGNVGVNGAASDFGSTSRALQVNSGTDGYASVLASAEGRTLQLLASDHNGVSAVGTRSDHALTICTNDTTRITVMDGGGRVVINAGGPDAGLAFNSVDGPRDMSGAGSPEGVVTAPKGSTWRRTDGGAGTTFWVKESGSGNTGWVAK